ncbi:MAG: hypothetical protein R2839_11485 [Thermomicrobiales bacterium]
MNPKERFRFPQQTGLVWLVAFLVFAVWTFWRFGGFDLWATVTLPDGSSVRFPDTFATVDHPFHATRAETLRQSLADGHLLRWIGNHQGGYPVEFYPLGAAWMEVVVWGLALGALPIMAIHKLVVIGVYLLPVAGFAVLARFGRLPWSIPVLAIVIHVGVRGWWWSGGSMELLEWGLLTNVASAALLPLVLGLHRFWLRDHHRWAVAAAASVAAIAIYTNVRTVLPLAAILAGCGLAAWLESRSGNEVLSIAVSSAAVVGLTVLLAAPLVIALIRFSDLYVFVRYSSYADLGDYWQSSLQAVSTPVMVLAIAGGIMALRSRRDDGATTVLIVLAVYVAGTSLVVLSKSAADLVSQLEATRLMPFQRLLVIYLAAYGVWAMIGYLLDLVFRPESDAVMPADAGGRPILLDTFMAATVLLFLAGYVGGWLPGIPASDRTTSDLVTTGNTAFAELREQVELADQTAEPGTAILVLGNVISWHDQLWSPQWSDRRFFYDDWLWYWQTDHYGAYDPLTSHAYDQDASTLTSEYLSRHGIGAVIVTGEAADAARTSPLLQLVREGRWSLYLVASPVTIVTTGEINLSAVEITGQQIVGVADQPSTEFAIRHNWFPRWSATVDGQPATISKTDDGSMRVEAGQPGETVKVSYRVDGWDWLGRLALLVGVLIAIGLFVPRFPIGLTPQPSPESAHR